MCTVQYIFIVKQKNIKLRKISFILKNKKKVKSIAIFEKKKELNVFIFNQVTISLDTLCQD